VTSYQTEKLIKLRSFDRH